MYLSTCILPHFHWLALLFLCNWLLSDLACLNLMDGWTTRNIVSDVYILTKGKKCISVEKNENVELTHTQIFCGTLSVLCE